MPRLHCALSRVRVDPVSENAAKAAAELLKKAGLHGHKYAIDATVAEAALRQPGRDCSTAKHPAIAPPSVCIARSCCSSSLCGMVNRPPREEISCHSPRQRTLAGEGDSTSACRSAAGRPGLPAAWMAGRTSKRGGR